jgi:antitoxin ParD1/3/4
MFITLGNGFERRIDEKVKSCLYSVKNQQPEILLEEVEKGFQQLAIGEISNRGVMGVFSRQVTNQVRNDQSCSCITPAKSCQFN